MKQTAVEFLIKEFSEILGPIDTKSMQDLLLMDAMNQAKEMEKQQHSATYGNAIRDTINNKINFEKYYNERFNK